MGKSVRVTNGKETLEIDTADLNDAVKDGYHPTERIIVANPKTKETYEIAPEDYQHALKDGFNFSDIVGKQQPKNPISQPAPFKATVDFSDLNSVLNNGGHDAQAEQHQSEVNAASQRIHDEFKGIDPAVKNVLLSYKKQAVMADFQNQIQQRGGDITSNNKALQNAQRLLPQASIKVSDEEVQNYKDQMQSDPAMAREALYEHAKLNPSKAKQISADVYRLDSQGRAQGNNTKQIQENATGIEKGDLDYSTWHGGTVTKPLGVVGSLVHGFNQREDQFRDYHFIANSKPEEVIQEMEKRRNSPKNADEPIPTPAGFGGGLGNMLGSEGITMGKGAIPSLLAAGSGGSAEVVAPWLGAVLTSPDFYQRGYANSFNQNYNDLRDQGKDPQEAYKTASDRAQFDAKADVALGTVMTAMGGKLGMGAAETKFSPGFMGAVKGVAKQLVASTPDAAALGIAGGGVQALKNSYSGKDISKDVAEAVLTPVALHYGIGIIAAGAKLVHPDLYKSAVDNMAKQPEDLVNKAIGEKVESGEITPEQANDAHLIIEDKRAQHEELLGKAKEIVAKGKMAANQAEPLQHAAQDDPEAFTAKLQDIADQAHKGETEQLTEKYGDDLINVAKQLFPKEPAKLKTEIHENETSDATETGDQTEKVANNGAAPQEPAPISNQQKEAAAGFLKQGIDNGTIDPEYTGLEQHADHVINFIRKGIAEGKESDMEKEFGKDLVQLSKGEASYPIVRNVKLKDNATTEQIAGAVDVGQQAANGQTVGSGNSQPSSTPGESQPEAQDTNQGQEKITPEDDLPFRNEPGDESVTGIRNSITAKKIEEAGLTPALKEVKRTHPEVWQEALNKVKKGYDPATLLAQLKKKPRPLTDTEDALLLIHQVDKESQLDAVNRDITEAGQKGDETTLAELQLQKAKIKDDLQDLYDVDKAVGTANARGLSARQMISDRRYSLVAMENEALALKEGKPLTAEEKEQIEKRYNDIKEARDKVQKRVDELEAENKALKEQKAAPEEKKGTTKSKRSKADYAKQRDEIVQKMREDILRAAKGGEGLTAAIPFAAQLKAVAPHVAKLVRSYIAQGIDNIEQIAKEIHGLLHPTIPELTENHVHDLVAGEFNEPKPKAAPSKMSEIKEQAKQMKYAVSDPELLRLRAEYERQKEAWGDDARKAELAKRSTGQKVQDTFVKWQRAFKLSGITTMAKLAMAAVTRISTTPVEEAVGGVYSKALPKVAAKATGEGNLNIRAEAKAITSAFTQGMKDSAAILSKKSRGQSDIEAVFGKGGNLPPEALGFFGQLHSATKAPVKRAAFERSLTKRIAANLKAGVDVSDPMVQSKIAMQAYKDANRAIFMQDNFISDSYRNFVNSVEKSKKYPAQGKAVSTALQWLIPFVKVPTNIVGEVGTNAAGVPIAAAKLIHTAFTKGLSNLSEDEADMVMRNLKKGSIGAGALLLGYFHPQSFGGYYQKYEKREPGDLKAGQTRAFGVTIPIWLQESPIFQTMQLGATVRRVKDKLVQGQPQGIKEGIWAGALGLVEHEPLVDQPSRIAGAITDAKERQYFLGELAKSTLVPAAVSNIAQFTDPAESRKPRTIAEHIETGIPGLREIVPEKNPSKAKGGHKKGSFKKEHRK